MRMKLFVIFGFLILFILFHYYVKFRLIESLLFAIGYVVLIEMLRFAEKHVRKSRVEEIKFVELKKYLIAEATLFLSALAITLYLSAEVIESLSFGFFFLVYLQWFYNVVDMERTFYGYPALPRGFVMYRRVVMLFGSTLCFYVFTFGETLGQNSPNP